MFDTIIVPIDLSQAEVAPQMIKLAKAVATITITPARILKSAKAASGTQLTIARLAMRNIIIASRR